MKTKEKLKTQLDSCEPLLTAPIDSIIQEAIEMGFKTGVNTAKHIVLDLLHECYIETLAHKKNTPEISDITSDYVDNLRNLIIHRLEQ